MTIRAFDFLEPNIPVGDRVDEAVDWLTETFEPVIDFIETVLQAMYDGLFGVLNAPPFLAMIAAFTVIGWLARSWRFAVFSVLGFYLIASMGMWELAMKTLTLILLSAFIAVLIAIPVGIWAAKSATVSGILRPVLDFMQTMPAMVYLLPTLAAFGIGEVPGMVSTIVFAMPPGVRFTELAIRQVDSEVVEAGNAFGSTPLRILREIQLPLALPTIMAGINQVIMLSLSMVVLAAMVGADGLGIPVLRGLSTLSLPQAINAGLAVVILAVYLDRVVASLSDRTPVVRASKVRD